jgi:hypothetical protein
MLINYQSVIKLTLTIINMTSIQQLQEHIKRLNDEKLLNQFDLYSSFNLQDTKEVIYYKIIEYELHKRRLLDHKIMEDNYEYEYAQ